MLSLATNIGVSPVYQDSRNHPKPPPNQTQTTSKPSPDYPSIDPKPPQTHHPRYTCISIYIYIFIYMYIHTYIC